MATVDRSVCWKRLNRCKIQNDKHFVNWFTIYTPSVTLTCIMFQYWVTSAIGSVAREQPHPTRARVSGPGLAATSSSKKARCESALSHCVCVLVMMLLIRIPPQPVR